MTALQAAGEAAVGPLSLGAIRLPPLDRVVTVEALSRASAAKLAYGDRKVSGAFGGAADRCATLRQAVSVGEE